MSCNSFFFYFAFSDSLPLSCWGQLQVTKCRWRFLFEKEKHFHYTTGNKFGIEKCLIEKLSTEWIVTFPFYSRERSWYYCTETKHCTLIKNCILYVKTLGHKIVSPSTGFYGMHSSSKKKQLCVSATTSSQQHQRSFMPPLKSLGMQISCCCHF